VRLACLLVNKVNFDVLRVPRVHHHVPGVAVEAVCPVVVAVGDEVRVGQEELLADVDDCE
jgi:hypothetical protein